MKKYTVVFILTLVYLLPSQAAQASPTFSYTKALLKSLERLEAAQNEVRKLDYTSNKPSDIIAAKLILQKAIKQIQKAPIEVEKFESSDNDYVLGSIRYIKAGCKRMTKVYKKIIALLDKRLNRTYLDHEDAFPLYVNKELGKLLTAADILHNATSLATYAMVDTTKVSDLGPTHLKITHQEFTLLKNMTAPHFPKNTNILIVKVEQPAKAALLGLHNFLEQDWKFSGSSVSVAGSVHRMELFDEAQLNTLNS